MKIAEGFILRKLGNNYVAVAIGQTRKNFNGLIQMNETGSFLWNCLQKECTKEQLITQLLENYETDYAQAESDVEEFLQKLQNAQIL